MYPQETLLHKDSISHHINLEFVHVKDIDKESCAQLFFLAITQSFLKVVPDLISETMYKQMSDYAKALFNTSTLEVSECSKFLSDFETDLQLFKKETHQILTVYYSKYIKEVEETFAKLVLEKLRFIIRFLSNASPSLNKEKKAMIMFSKDLLQKKEFLSLIDQIAQELKKDLVKEYPYPSFFDASLEKNIKIKPCEISLLGNKFLNDQIKFQSYLFTEKILSTVQIERRGEIPSFLEKVQKESQETILELSDKFRGSAIMALKKTIQAIVKTGVINKVEGSNGFYLRLGFAAPFHDNFPMQEIDKHILIKLSKNLHQELEQALKPTFYNLHSRLEILYSKINAKNSQSSNILEVEKIFDENRYSKRLEFKLINNGLCNHTDLMDKPSGFFNRFFNCFTHPKEVIHPKRISENNLTQFKPK